MDHSAFPGTERQKNILSRCVNCHTLERVIDNKHDAAAWKDVISRMATYSNNSFHLKPQVRKEARDMDRFVPNIDEVAAYLASINRSAGDFTWQPKTDSARQAAPAPAWSSPNTTCPIRPSSRTT